jgi:phosphomannomutase
MTADETPALQEDIHFGTDGWRAIIGEDFTNDNLIRVVDSATRAFKEEYGVSKGTLVIGYDCRKDARKYAGLAASVAATHGLTVKLSNAYCPTPALCWQVAHDEQAIGGIMLTSSHNPAEYLGVKLRMADGGASSKEFTDRVESALLASPTKMRGMFEEVDLMSPYLEALKGSVDTEAIKNAELRLVVDPLYGAGRKYLAGLLEEMGATVTEINNAADPTFDGLHPEPIEPWINRGIAKVKELGYEAGFITDGDADRIGAIDENGNFVNPHKIMCLLVSHLVEDKGHSGRVVSTITSSAMLGRQCARLGLELTSTPVGFKWIYAEMGAGDVMIGGEESGGIGIPTHVKERDGLLMALLLAEMMAERTMSLAELVSDMQDKVGKMEFSRVGLQVSEKQMEKFREETIPSFETINCCGKKVTAIDRRDGVKITLEEDAWVMCRPSGTEPLVRIYAEAKTLGEVEDLIAFATDVVHG